MAAFVWHRVQSLQGRHHGMWHMMLQLDPTRTSTRELMRPQVINWLNTIIEFKLKNDCWLGKEPYYWNIPAPLVCFIFSFPTCCGRLRLGHLFIAVSFTI